MTAKTSTAAADLAALRAELAALRAEMAPKTAPKTAPKAEPPYTRGSLTVPEHEADPFMTALIVTLTVVHSETAEPIAAYKPIALPYKKIIEQQDGRIRWSYATDGLKNHRADLTPSK